MCRLCTATPGPCLTEARLCCMELTALLPLLSQDHGAALLDGHLAGLCALEPALVSSTCWARGGGALSAGQSFWRLPPSTA